MMEQHRGSLDERWNVTSNSHIVMIKRVRLKPTQDDQVLPIGRPLHSFGRTAQSKHVFYGKTCNALTWKDVTASRKVPKEKKEKKKKKKKKKKKDKDKDEDEKEQGRIHGYPSCVRMGRSSAGEGH